MAVAVTVSLRCLALVAVIVAGVLMFGDPRELTLPAIDTDLGEQLITGAASGDEPSWREALDRGAPVDRRSRMGLTPLMFAAEQGDLVLARRLIEAGADVSATSDYQFTPLVMAALRGQTEMMQLLLDAGAAIDQPTIHGGTALHAAAGQLQHEAAMLLIAHGANVNARDRDDRTPLMVLADIGAENATLAEDLIASGCRR
jgi:ankyrin repeat protein